VPVTFRQNATDADNRLRLNLAAGYVQDQVEISRYVQVVGGLRFDYFDLGFHNNRNGEELSRIDRLVSPRLGVVIKPVTQLSVYGSYSISFLPGAGDQFSSLAANTQTLEPEKFTNYEVGVKWDFRPNLSFTSAVYRLDRTNTRANDPSRPGFFVLTGSQRTNGFEIGLNGNITRAWTMTGGYSYQDAFITSTTTAAPAGRQVAQVRITVSQSGISIRSSRI
jgi:catecholate siderophore receptor